MFLDRRLFGNDLFLSLNSIQKSLSEKLIPKYLMKLTVLKDVFKPSQIRKIIMLKVTIFIPSCLIGAFNCGCFRSCCCGCCGDSFCGGLVILAKSFQSLIGTAFLTIVFHESRITLVGAIVIFRPKRTRTKKNSMNRIIDTTY